MNALGFLNPPDIKVRYRFLSAEEGGGKLYVPFQGLKRDWAYVGDDINKTGIYMIWAEFEDGDGQPLPVGSLVPLQGTARMYIASDELRQQINRKRIRIGTKGFFMEGARKIAEAEVISIINLHYDRERL